MDNFEGKDQKYVCICMYVEFMRICQRHLKITDLNVVNIYEIEPERMVSYKYAYD